MAASLRSSARSSRLEGGNSRDEVTALVEQLIGRLSPFSGDGLLMFSMRILGSMLQPTVHLDSFSTGKRIEKALSKQGGDVMRFQALHRKLSADRLYNHKA